MRMPMEFLREAETFNIQHSTFNAQRSTGVGAIQSWELNVSPTLKII
jgi:hypothetical protein